MMINADSMYRTLGALFANRQPSLTEKCWDQQKTPNSWEMEPCVAYGNGDADNGWVLARFRNESELQTAFNAVFDAIPAEKRAAEWTPGDKSLRWFLLLPTPTWDDPLRQYGGISVQWEKPLGPGEHIARARLHSPDATGTSISFVDIVVTAETLPQLRASGKYAEIHTPKGLQ